MLEHSDQFNFDESMLICVAGGKSILDIPRLNIKTPDQADQFIESYGFDLKDEKTQEKLWYFFRRAYVLLTERLGYAPEQIPEPLRDRKNLKDIRELLYLASCAVPQNRQEQELRRWACALLRCMHVYVHHEYDLYHTFAEEIQKQVLTPFENIIFHDGTTHKVYLRTAKESLLENIEVVSYTSKAFKSSSSSVVKLLAKPEAFTIRLFDHLGVRIVTKTVFDIFRVIKFLVNEGVISYPQIISDQTTNNVYPISKFMETLRHLSNVPNMVTDLQIEQAMDDLLKIEDQNPGLIKKENKYSGDGHRFIKFICRKLIRTQETHDEKEMQFFFPYEVQIMDEKSFIEMQSGPAAHEEYKKRQNEAAKKRLFPEDWT